MLQASEKPLQKGKYTLAKEFSRGYLQEIKTIREHYGQGNNFIKPASHAKSKTISFGKIGIDKFIDNKNELKSSKMNSFNCVQTSQIRFGSSNRQERFENLNLVQQTDFPSEYSQINFLVENKKDINIKQIAEKFYENNFVPENLEKSRERIGNNLFNPYQNMIKQFNLKNELNDSNKIARSQKEEQEQKMRKCPSSFPSERKADLLSQKLLRQNLAWEKANRSLIQKKFRICKSAYRSGILAVDGPTNQFSELYKTENEFYRKKEERRKEESAKRREELRKMMMTNSEIEFGRPEQRKEIKKIASAHIVNSKNPSEGLEKDDQRGNFHKNVENLEFNMDEERGKGGGNQEIWIRKEGERRVEQSRRRIFGEEGKMEELGGRNRRKNIYWNEHKGRDWNIISWKKEELLNV